MKFIIYLTPGVGAIVLCQTVSAIFGGLALIMIAAAYFMTFMSRGKQKFWKFQTTSKFVFNLNLFYVVVAPKKPSYEEEAQKPPEY